MIPLSPAQVETLRSWFLPDRPGKLLGLHALKTGLGRFFADCWPGPQAVLVAVNDNFELAGNANVLAAEEVEWLSGIVDAPPSFVPLLKAAFPGLHIWERVAYTLDGGRLPEIASPLPVRRLEQGDGQALARLSQELSWIYKTWNGPVGLAGSGFAWGAWEGPEIVSAACPFFVGEQYEEIGVVTEADYRRRGLGMACANALAHDIVARGRCPSWSTDMENKASRRVAEKLGLRFYGYDRLYVVKRPIPI